MRILFLYYLLGLVTVFGQRTIPENYFAPPLKIPLKPSGTFGELRANHFHSGLDLKTNGEEGLEVHTSAKGNVSRIKISHFGYGKAIYVAHPNGYTTVYAHLKKFAPKIEAYVKKRQYAKESYEIELFPKSGVLALDKNEILGFSGNTGGSGGPHLHFEIRDANAKPMNPLNFGLKVKDTIKPVLQSLWIYPLDDQSQINGTQNPQQLQLIPCTPAYDFKTSKIKAYGNIGIGVAAYDNQNNTPNKNGIYSLSTEVNGQKKLQLKLDKFSFSETRYINRLIDYERYHEHQQKVVKLFVEKNNPLSLFTHKKNNGFIPIKDSLNYNVIVTVSDQSGNTLNINIPIEGKYTKNITPLKEIKTPYLVKSNDEFVYNSNNVNIYIPKGSLYEDAYLDISTLNESISIHKDVIPMHRKMTISFNVSKYHKDDQKQLIIARKDDENNEIDALKTTRKAQRIYARTRSMGTYLLLKDSIPPAIVALNISKDKFVSEQKLEFKINDELSGIRTYRGTINNKFILLEYDYKTGMLFYDFNDKVSISNQNTIKLTVSDYVGNISVFETVFYRKI